MDGAGALVPVSAARTVLPAPLGPVETQTHKIGLIVPPPDIRAVVDKTAQFVSRNGGRPPPLCLGEPRSRGQPPVGGAPECSCG